jgi:predicted small metal-binding protein
VTGRCDHCEWAALTTSYPEMVKSYQDHLRDEHPRTWLRV